MTKSLPTRELSLRLAPMLPAFVLAVFFTVFFSWNPFGAPPEHAYFNALLRGDKPGTATLIADVDGTSLRKEKMITASVEGGGHVSHIRFMIPAGQLHAFIFRPRVEPGDVDVLRCWVTDQSEKYAAVMAPGSFLELSTGQSQALPDGSVRYHSIPGAEVAAFKPEPPVDLAIVPPPPIWQLALVFVGTFCLALLFTRLAGRVPWRGWAAASWRRIRLHPRSAIFVCALCSVVLSCFPVVFCGKSFTSPDNGMLTLYEGFPGVPGAQGGRVENPVGSDMGATVYWHMPTAMLQHRSIFNDGEFPYWNRYNWCGVSLWAQCMSMLGDPLHWPAVLTGGAAWAWDFKFVMAKILFAFGVGLLVRVTSRSLSASLLLALSAPWIGFFAYRFCHPAFFSMCYAPWLLLPWLEAARAQNRRQVAAWALLLILTNWWQLNSGTAKESSAFLVFLNGAGLFALLFAQQPWRERLVRLGMFVWANALFLLLSAPLWMIFIDALGKAWTCYDDPKVCQIQPGLFVGLFDDIFYRQMRSLEFLTNPSVNFFILLGTAWALVRARTLVRDGFFLSTLLVAIGSAALAFGVVSPLFLVKVPMIRNIYHFDDTFSSVLFILLFVLAGYGFRECRRGMRRSEWSGDWWIVMAMVGLLLGSFLGMTNAAHRYGRTFLLVGETIPKSEFMWAYGAAITLALAILPWAWRAARRREPAAAAWALVAVCALATLHFRHGMYLVTRFDLYTMNPKTRLDYREIASPAVQQIKHAMQDRHEPARTVGLDWLMTPGFSAVLGLETISGPEALENPASRELSAALHLPQMWSWKTVIWRDKFAEHHRALDFLGVRYLLDKPGMGASLPDVKLLGSTDLDVVESESAWPRAFFTDAVVTYGDVEGMAALVDKGDGRPLAAMLPEERAHVPLPERPLAARKIVTATNYHLTQNATAFDIDAPSAGLVVLGEAWVPGDILVTIDGQSANAVRTNHAFRGVYVSQPGKHRIEFRYWPGVMESALWLCGVGFVCTLLSLWLWLRSAPQVAAAVRVASPMGECLKSS